MRDYEEEALDTQSKRPRAQEEKKEGLKEDEDMEADEEKHSEPKEQARPVDEAEDKDEVMTFGQMLLNISEIDLVVDQCAKEIAKHNKS